METPVVNSPVTAQEPKTGLLIDIAGDFDTFLMPQVPKSKAQASRKYDAFNASDLDCSSFSTFNLSAELARPSLLFDDGRESLGILPQFKLPSGNKCGGFELERADSFLVGTSSERHTDPFYNMGRPSLIYDGRDSLGILPQFKNSCSFVPREETLAELEVCLLSPAPINTASKVEEKELIPVESGKLDKDSENDCDNLLTKFKKDCEAIERGDFLPDVKDITDDNYSVYVEANFLASKIADNSILDISQEGGTFLDKTPQPDFIDDDSLNKSERDKKVDTEAVYKQLDLLLPPSISPLQHPIAANSTKQTQPQDVIQLLSAIMAQQENNQVCAILSNAMQQISELLQSQAEGADSDGKNAEVEVETEVETGSLFEDDSGHSSTENDKAGDCNAALDLSLKTCSTDNAHAQALDLSFHKESMPRRLSITFSHKNDPALPEKQASNNLKQQTLHMRQLWAGSASTANTTPAPSTDGSVSILSNDSKHSVASSTGSCSMSGAPALSTRVKLKSKKSEGDLQLLKRGPLKAVVPLMALNTSLTMEQVGGGVARGAPKQRTPVTGLRPMAQSTPEEFSASAARRKLPTIGSPLARPGRATPILQRGKKLAEANRSVSLGGIGQQAQEARGGAVARKAFNRGKSSADLKQPAEAERKQPLRRCMSVGGKENLNFQQVYKQSSHTGPSQTGLSKLPQKSLMKPVNLVEKMKKK